MLRYSACCRPEDEGRTHWTDVAISIQSLLGNNTPKQTEPDAFALHTTILSLPAVPVAGLPLPRSLCLLLKCRWPALLAILTAPLVHLGAVMTTLGTRLGRPGQLLRRDITLSKQTHLLLYLLPVREL